MNRVKMIQIFFKDCSSDCSRRVVEKECTNELVKKLCYSKDAYFFLVILSRNKERVVYFVRIHSNPSTYTDNPPLPGK